MFDPSCPSLRRTIVPIEIVVAGALFVVTSSLIAFAAWSTVLAAAAVIVIALASATAATP